MEAVRNRDERNVRHPAATAADHPLWLAAEEINDRTWVHGEFVALGGVVIAWYCGEDPATLIRVARYVQGAVAPRRHGRFARGAPQGTGTRAHVFMSDTSRGNDVNSILRHEPLTGASFDALWAFLQQA